MNTPRIERPLLRRTWEAYGRLCEQGQWDSAAVVLQQIADAGHCIQGQGPLWYASHVGAIES